MIKIKLSQIYNNQPYYTITKNKMIYSAIEAEEAVKVISYVRKGREKVDTSEIEQAVNQIKKDSDKLIFLLSSKVNNKNKKSK